MIIKSVGNGIFTIMADNGCYLTTSSTNNLSQFEGTSDTDPKAQWIFVSDAEFTQLIEAEMKRASENNPVDVTYLIEAAGINNGHDRRMGAWKIDRGLEGNANYQYGISDKDSEPLFEFFRSANSSCYNACSYSQNVTLRPGLYKLEVQGFYRDGDYVSAAEAHASGKEEIFAYLFAGSERSALKSIFAEASNTQRKGWSTQTTQGYVPDTFTEAGYVFQTGAYQNELFFTVNTVGGDKDVLVNLGIKVDVSYIYNNWTAFDNFRLIYYGPKVDKKGVTKTKKK